MTEEILKKANLLSVRIAHREQIIKDIEGCYEPEITLKYNCNRNDGSIDNKLWIKIRPDNKLWNKILNILKEDLIEAKQEFELL